MATLLLIPDCSRTLPCDPNRRSGLRDHSWSWENLIYLADFLRASNQRQVSLGGGEPTLHPECVDFILYLLQRDFEVTVFTGGVVSPPRFEEFRRHLTETPLARLTWVCNLPDPVRSPMAPAATQRLHRFLSLVGPRTQASYTIKGLDFRLDFLFDYLSRFGLQRHVRLGLVPPAAASRDRAIPSKDVRRVVERLYSFRHLFDTHRVRPHFDCHFPPCTFSDAELGWLHRFGGRGPGGCWPSLVVGPDMRVSHCFPLANYPTRSLFEFDSMERIEGHLARLRDEIKGENPGFLEACEDCRCREGGGCGGGDWCRITGRGLEAAPISPAGGEDGISQDRLPG